MLNNFKGDAAMKTKIIFRASILLCFIFTSAFSSCKSLTDPYAAPSEGSLEKFKEMSGYYNWPGKNGPVRDGIDLSKCNIPSLSDVPIVTKPPFFSYIAKEENRKILPYYRSVWQIDKQNLVQVWVVFAESCEEAHEYAIYRYFNSSNPQIPKPDDMAIAGDISFFNGHGFIRNNIFVTITPEGEMVNRKAALAKDIDNLLLARPTASSAEEFKPRIQRYEIAKSLVESNTQTKLFLEVADPKGSELYYFWQVTAGGVSRNDFGEWYYDSSWVDPGTTQTITLIVLNDRGYCRTSSIDIKIK